MQSYSLSGNELRQFAIKETSDFVTPSTSSPTYRIVTDINGNTLQYVGECVNYCK